MSIDTCCTCSASRARCLVAGKFCLLHESSYTLEVLWTLLYPLAKLVPQSASKSPMPGQTSSAGIDFIMMQAPADERPEYNLTPLVCSW